METRDDETEETDSPFRVLGVAVVVDLKGKGARTVVRYPTGPLVQDSTTEDLFFRLHSRQIAKLFRPKPALCGQPMTLSIGRTVFCSLAILMDQSSQEQIRYATANNQDEKDGDHLVLFSVIVALEPNTKTHGLPIAGWFEGAAKAKELKKDSENHLDINTIDLGGRQGTPIFESIRRVHRSLIRVCRVLEREELRCQYISLQTKQFNIIRQDLKKKWAGLQKIDVSAPAIQPNPSITSSRPASVNTSPVSLTSKKTLRADRRSSQKSIISSVLSRDESVDQQQSERDQELLDVYMVAPPPENHHGNLAQEIVKFYHALSRNDFDFLSQAPILNDDDGTLFINRHIEVAIEPASLDLKFKQGLGQIRPYHTLLFPSFSPKEIQEYLSQSNSPAPRRISHFLDVVTPQKSLQEIAAEYHFPVEVALDLASYLVHEKGFCVFSPVLSQQSRFACADMTQLQDTTLAFAQQFGIHMNIFKVVSFLTENNRRFDQIIRELLDENSTNFLSQTLRSDIFREALFREDDEEVTSSPPTNAMFTDTLHHHDQRQSSSTRTNDAVLNDLLEERFVQMTIWLCAHGVLLQFQDYLVGKKSSTALEEITKDNQQEKKTEGNTRNRRTDDTLYQDLAKADCLSGNTTMDECAYRISEEKHRLYAFAERHPSLQILRRVPSLSDIDP